MLEWGVESLEGLGGLELEAEERKDTHSTSPHPKPPLFLAESAAS